METIYKYQGKHPSKLDVCVVKEVTKHDTKLYVTVNRRSCVVSTVKRVLPSPVSLLDKSNESKLLVHLAALVRLRIGDTELGTYLDQSINTYLNLPKRKQYRFIDYLLHEDNV